jgi:SAM-dependent methyltransferase
MRRLPITSLSLEKLARTRRGSNVNNMPIVNTEQAEAWNNVEGTHWAEQQDRYDALNASFTEPLLDGSAIAEADTVLDMGGGTGHTPRQAARRAGRGRVLGLDLSSPMLERARASAAAEGITNVTFEQGDAQIHPFEAATFDVAISRFGVMFFADPVAAFTNIGRALRPGGRLGFACWQELTNNEWLMATAGAALQHVPFPDLGVPGAPGPFSLADHERIRGILGSAGFQDVDIEAVERPMRLGDDADDAVGFLRGTGMARALFEDAEPAAVERALEAVTEALRVHEQPGGVYLNGAAWLVVSRLS